jgi:hypothetical protein
MKNVKELLSTEMVELLQGKTLVMLHVFDPKLERVISSAMSWVYAIDEKTIRLAVDHKSRLVELGESNAEMVLTVIGMTKVYSIFGESKVRSKLAEDMTLKMAIIEVSVDEIRDITFYGAEITQNPLFRKTYNEKLVKKLDDEVEKVIVNV